VLFVCFSFLQQEISSGFVGFGTVCSLSPQCFRFVWQCLVKFYF